MLQEFKKFAVKGNVMDLAIGIIIGVAFGKIVSSFVKDIIMPPIGMLLGEIDFSKLNFVIQKASEENEMITLNYGIFISTLVNFIIVAFVIFIIVTQLNKLKKKEETKFKKPTEEILLLREIRDAIRKKQ